MTRWFLCALLIAGCRPRWDGVQPVVDVSSTYYQRFSQYTERVKVYQNFETAFFLDVTYHAWPFREGYLQELRTLRNLDDPTADKLAAEERRDFERYYTFTLNLYTPDASWNDIGTGKSIWTLSLLAGDTRLAPDRIDILPLRDRETSFFFPYMNQWAKTYRIRFERPKESTASTLKLTIASVLGSRQLEFEAGDRGAPTETPVLLDP